MISTPVEHFHRGRIAVGERRTSEAIRTIVASHESRNRVYSEMIVDHRSSKRYDACMAKKASKFSDELRQAIENCGKTRYEISKMTGIDQATLSRFMHGKGGLSIDGLDSIAECIGLKITLQKRSGKGKGR